MPICRTERAIVVVIACLTAVAGCGTPAGPPGTSESAETQAPDETFSGGVAKQDLVPAVDTFAVAADSATQPAGPSPTTDWHIFRGNPQSTGVAASDLPERLDLLWRYRVEKGAFEGTPAIVDGTVYVGDLDGKVFALDLASGELRWEFAAKDSGFMTSPSVKDDRLFIGDFYGMFFCLDTVEGKQLWSHETEGEINSCANFYKGSVLIGSQDASLYCFDAPTGKLNWKLTVEDQIRCTPTVAGNRTFLAGCDGRLHVVDLDQGAEIAAVQIESPTGNTPAVVGNMAYFGTEGGTFFGVDWKDAKIVWRHDNERGMSYRSSAAATDRLVIVGGHSKLIYAFDAAKGDVVWEFAALSRIDSSPVIVRQRVFVATSGGRLYALNIADGKELWQYEAGGGFVGSPAVAAGRLVIASDDGVVFCFGQRD